MKKLPIFNEYTVDYRLAEFRKVVSGESIEFIPFDSKEGRRILMEMRPEWCRGCGKAYQASETIFCPDWGDYCEPCYDELIERWELQAKQDRRRR